MPRLAKPWPLFMGLVGQCIASFSELLRMLRRQNLECGLVPVLCNKMRRDSLRAEPRIGHQVPSVASRYGLYQPGETDIEGEM